MSTMIKVENIGKKYLLGHLGRREPYVSLRDELASGARDLGSRLLGRARPKGLCAGKEDFWALDDVSFEVQQGERVGIIGRNGAGKSTLLKILSRITEPSTGLVRMRGRVASLLEVGTGFHPELTGRENIFLNGAILGMGREEIKRKFDEIVAFAEIEKFLDTPVKRYSSGMYVRLAFAVAAHLEPEILIVDEVLAVGDASFQKKCLQKMGDAGREGRTVLFVSHNMVAVEALCPRAILLENGRLRADGRQREVIDAYLCQNQHIPNGNLSERADRGGNGSIRFQKITVEASDPRGPITAQTGVKISLEYSSSRPIVNPKIMIGLYDKSEVATYGLDSTISGGLPGNLPSSGTVTCTTAPLQLTPGPISLNIAIFNGGDMADYVQNAVDFFVEEVDFYGTGRMPERGWTIGLIKYNWDVA